VFNVSEGQQFRVGRVDVNIGGDNPHTRRSVVLTRLSQRPGDIVDSRQIDASERRIVSSQLFANEPFRGVKPELVVKPSEWQQDVQNVAEQQQQPPPPDAYRGQSPEPAPADLGRQSAWPVGEPRP